MIKGIILDIDGVIVGEKIGYNSPYPHPDVISAMKEIRSNGICISLCTAKPYFAIEKIIQDANLDNLHITDGGSVLIDPITNNIYKKHSIESSLVKQIVELFLEKHVYTECYTIDEYFIQKDQTEDMETTRLHTHILQKEPVIVKDLVKTTEDREITKIMPIAHTKEEQQQICDLFFAYSDVLTLSLGSTSDSKSTVIWHHYSHGNFKKRSC